MRSRAVYVLRLDMMLPQTSKVQYSRLTAWLGHRAEALGQYAKNYRDTRAVHRMYKEGCSLRDNERLQRVISQNLKISIERRILIGPWRCKGSTRY